MVEPCSGAGQSWAGTYAHTDTLVRAPTHPPCTRSPGTHEDVEELEDALVRQDVQDVARDGLDDRQAVDLVLDQGVDGVEEAVGDGDIVGGGMAASRAHPQQAGTHLLLGEMQTSGLKEPCRYTSAKGERRERGNPRPLTQPRTPRAHLHARHRIPSPATSTAPYFLPLQVSILCSSTS